MNSQRTRQFNLSKDDDNRTANTNEQMLYQHIISSVQKEEPPHLIERFRKLFVDGMGYPEKEIEQALYRIIAFLENQQDFNYIISRCCYILINRWQLHSKNKEAIAELVDLFKSSSRFAEAATRSRCVKRLRELILNFTQSEEYRALHRLASTLNPDRYFNNKQTNYPLAKLIYRYPFLYSHSLVNENVSEELQQTIREIQTQRQQQFEVKLAQYTLYLLRQVKTAPKSNSSTGGGTVKPVQNPTLLTDEQLYRALKEFVGKVKESYTYRDLAQNFLARTSQIESYQAFKFYLYEYLIDPIDPKYGNHQFNERLYKHLKNFLPEKDFDKLDDFLILRTCSELFNFLVESPGNPNFYLFIDLISNLGSVRTIGLLLKIVLLCSQVKPQLEKRFSMLFNYYESQKVDDICWLVRSLENLNVALVVNFGAVDVSFIKQGIT